jgi:protein-S-isoprenylcysteine O-methyltransferase Ste14
MEEVAAFFAPWVIYLIIFISMAYLPGRWVTGYVKNTETGEPLRYRLNGWFTLVLLVALWFLVGYMEWLPWDWLYTWRWYSLAGAFTFGMLFTIWIVVPQPSTGKSFLADFFLGRLENPQWQEGRIDAKMWLYLIGAVMLVLNVLSFGAHHHMTYGSETNPGIFVCSGMLIFFVCDYLTFERVHLYTYDLFAERVGFKLGWGCLTFYPYFYSIALWSTVHLPNPGWPTWSYVVLSVVFLTGWSFARGANMQKFFFKLNPERTFLGIKPEFITDGHRKLLVNGYWGMSRHVNYMGEVLMATAIALSVGYPGSIWPWLYPLYYVALFIPRQIDDDARCAEKYGPLWKEYVRKVPYRIIPFIY